MTDWQARNYDNWFQVLNRPWWRFYANVDKKHDSSCVSLLVVYLNCKTWLVAEVRHLTSAWSFSRSSKNKIQRLIFVWTLINLRLILESPKIVSDIKSHSQPIITSFLYLSRIINSQVSEFLNLVENSKFFHSKTSLWSLIIYHWCVIDQHWTWFIRDNFQILRNKLLMIKSCLLNIKILLKLNQNMLRVGI